MYFVHICYSAIIISLRKIKMHVCRKEEVSYKGLEHKLTLPREKKLFIFFNSICGGFWGLSIPHINMFIVTDCVYILFEICMFFSTQFIEIAVYCIKVAFFLFTKNLKLSYIID